MSEARKPFARVVPSDGRYYKVAGVIAKPSAPQDAEGDVRTINAAVERERREAAAKALRAFADSEALKDDFGHGEVVTKHDVRTALRAEADQVEKGGAS